MAGLFNADTQLEALLERQRQQNVAQQQQFGQLFGAAAGNRRQAAANTVGAQIGAAFGQGLAGGILGEPENIQQARQAVQTEQQLQQSLANINYQDPKSIQEASKRLINAGLVDSGMQLAQKAIEVGRTQQQEQMASVARQEAAKDLTTRGFGGIAKQVAAGQIAVEKGYEMANKGVELSPGERYVSPITGKLIAEGTAKPTDQFSLLTDEDKARMGLNPSKQYQMNLKDNKVSQIGGDGTSVNITNDAGTWNKITDNYRQDTSDIRKEYDQIAKIKAAVDTPGGASPQALQASIANLFGGQTRAVSELNRWATFGNLPDRVSNSVNRFFKGDYTETAVNDIRRLVRSYEASLAEKHNATNQRYQKITQANNVDPDTILLEPPQVQTFNFEAMSPQEILEIDPASLAPDQKEDLEAALDKLL